MERRSTIWWYFSSGTSGIIGDSLSWCRSSWAAFSREPTREKLPQARVIALVGDRLDT
jgi:hypothetical protein